MDGDIGCRHSGAKRLTPWRGLDGPAQAKPVVSKKAVNRVEIVSTPESPGWAPRSKMRRVIAMPGQSKPPRLPGLASTPFGIKIFGPNGAGCVPRDRPGRG